MRRWIVPCLVVASLATSAVFPGGAPPQESASETAVRAFVEAFNAHDVERMLTFVTDDVEWLSVSGRAVGVEAEGKEALSRSMKEYFGSCATCRSELEWVKSAGSRVATLERARWESKGVPKSQQSLAVYEFRENRIGRVYYFPVEDW